MIKLKHILNEQNESNAGIEWIKEKNRDIVKRIKTMFINDEDMPETIKTILETALYHYLVKVNTDASKTVGDMQIPNGVDSAKRYMDAFKNAVYKTVNNIPYAKKLILSKLQNRQEFETALNNIDSKLEEIVKLCTIEIFMYIHNINNKKEIQWYNQAYKQNNSRINDVKTHLKKWIISQIYD